MGFADCLREAVKARTISQKESEDLLRRFEELRGQFGLDLGEGAAACAAREALVKEMKAESIEQARRAGLMKKAVERVDFSLSSYRNADGSENELTAALKLLEHFGFAGFSSVEGRTKSIIGMAQAQLEEALMAFDRTAITARRAYRWRPSRR